MNSLYLNLYIRFQMFIEREDGQDMVEYALAAAVICLAAVATLRGLATGLSTAYSNINAQFAAAIS